MAAPLPGDERRAGHAPSGAAHLPQSASGHLPASTNHLGPRPDHFGEPVQRHNVLPVMPPKPAPVQTVPTPAPAPAPRANGMAQVAPNTPSLVSNATSQSRSSELVTPATPTAAGPPKLGPKNAHAVPPPTREAVVVADKHAASQPPVEEKQAAELREIKGEEPVGTVVEGIEDDSLWVLLRSFNNQVNHVLHPAVNTPADQPDLRQTNLPNVPYRSDTLKSNLERLIGGLAPPSARGIHEIMRLTDWHNEFNRTAYYCAAYFLSWTLGYTLITCTVFWMVLICYPDTRRVLFPYQPPPLQEPPVMVTDPVSKGGEATNVPLPATGTGLSRAELAEEHSVEITAVLGGYVSTLLFGSKAEEGNAVVGPKDPVDNWDDPDLVVTDTDGKILGYKTTATDPNMTLVEVENQVIPIRKDKVAKKTAEDDVERKREELVLWMAKTTETSVGISADLIEIMQKALSPPAVYPDQYARFKIAALLIVPALALHFVPARLFCRGATFIFGVVFWGHEWLHKAAREFVRLVPDWKQYIDPRNNILAGVPTDAQLTLHLLRVAETEGDPLPPPPVAPNLEETKEAIKDAQDPSGNEAAKEELEDDHKPRRVRRAAKKTKNKTKGAFKKVARKLAGMGSDVAVVGEERKLRGKIDGLVLKAKWGDDVPVGGYAAKLDGSSGHLFLDEEEECISWIPMMSKKPEKIWYIDDLVEMKKDGLGVSRLALAAMSGAEIASLGLSLRFAKTADEDTLQSMTEEQQASAAQSAKDTLVFKGVEAREELFNRLVAIGNQRWEML